MPMSTFIYQPLRPLKLSHRRSLARSLGSPRAERNNEYTFNSNTAVCIYTCVSSGMCARVCVFLYLRVELGRLSHRIYSYMRIYKRHVGLIKDAPPSKRRGACALARYTLPWGTFTRARFLPAIAQSHRRLLFTFAIDFFYRYTAFPARELTKEASKTIPIYIYIHTPVHVYRYICVCGYVYVSVLSFYVARNRGKMRGREIGFFTKFHNIEILRPMKMYLYVRMTFLGQRREIISKQGEMMGLPGISRTKSYTSFLDQ